MPTREERREVADRFRDFEALRPIFKESNICAFLEALGVKGYLSWEDICEKLADMIEPEPERTCKPLKKWHEDSPWPYLVCSECGEPLNYRENNGDYELLPYCAGCGAKVIE